MWTRKSNPYVIVISDTLTDMNKQLMLNDYIASSDGIKGKVIILYTDAIVIKDDNGEEYWLVPSTAKPIPLTDEWMREHNVLAIAEKNHCNLDFSRKHRLKVILTSGDGTTQITYYFPKPQYVHELQHILRQFNEIEL